MVRIGRVPQVVASVPPYSGPGPVPTPGVRPPPVPIPVGDLPDTPGFHLPDLMEPVDPWDCQR